MVVPIIVGVPVGVNPVAPHSISHVVADPFSIQAKSAEVAVKLVAVKADGSGQARLGLPSIVKSSIYSSHSFNDTAWIAM